MRPRPAWPGLAGTQPDRRDLAEPRRARILEIVNERGSVRVSELAEIVGVAQPTVRKDVADLDRHRLLRRIHGGAIATHAACELPIPLHEVPVADRAVRNVESKDAIAGACTAEIAAGDSVYLDSGSTVEAIARRLSSSLDAHRRGARARHVNVLTNALGVAEALADCAAVRTTVLGGQYRVTGGCFVGPLALTAIEQFSVDVAFIGVSGLCDDAFSVADVAEAQLKRAVMEHSRRVIVPMDHTKVGASDFVRLCALGRAHALVVDQDDGNLAALCAGAGVRLAIAGP